MNDARLTADQPIPPGLSYPGAEVVLLAARTLLLALVSRLLVPAALMLMGTISRFGRNEILETLRPVEQLLRRLIVVEATELARTHPFAEPKRGPRRHPLSLSPEFHVTDSTRWRAGFVISRPAAHNDRKWARRAQPIETFATRPLAVRLEAAIRVATDPTSFIRRLARRISRGDAQSAARVFLSPFTQWDAINDHLAGLLRHLVNPPAPDTS